MLKVIQVSSAEGNSGADFTCFPLKGIEKARKVFGCLVIMDCEIPVNVPRLERPNK